MLHHTTPATRAPKRLHYAPVAVALLAAGILLGHWGSGILAVLGVGIAFVDAHVAERWPGKSWPRMVVGVVLLSLVILAVHWWVLATFAGILAGHVITLVRDVRKMGRQ
jgi:hypothetical protein